MLVLPFHLMISYSSLVIFMAMVMPASINAMYGDDVQAYYNDLFSRVEPARPSGTAAPLISLAQVYAQVREQAPGSDVNWIEVQNPGDLNARVRLDRSASEGIAVNRGASWLYDGVQGTLLSGIKGQSTPSVIAAGLYGLHMGHFAGPTLRWLYFVFGLAGTAVIGTGLVMWLGKRQLKHAKSGTQPFELRLVEVLNIASMSGLVVAVAAFFWANRLLPVALEGRADWEINSFFIAWGLALLHALLRPGRRAWGEQLMLAAVLFAGLPLLNALTTDTGLHHSIAQGDWLIAALDLTALGCGLFLAWVAAKMLRPPVLAPKRAARTPKAAPLIESGVQ